MTEALAGLIADYQKTDLFTDCYAAAVNLKSGEIRKVEAYSSSRRVFDLASLTKALSTTLIAYGLLSDEDLKLPLRTLVPALDGRVRPAHLDLTPWSLLRHQTGLPGWANFWLPASTKPGNENRDETVLNTLARLPTYRYSPEITEIYSDVGFLLLGLALERLAQDNLENLFATLPIRPCGLTFRPDPADAVATGFCQIRGRDTVGEAYDENCAFLGGDCAHAGLFARGDELAAFLMELPDTSLGQRVLRSNAAQADLAKAKKQSSLAGWRLGDDAALVCFDDGMSMGHYGFTGTAFWVARDLSKALILLTNRTISGRMSPKIKDFRRSAFALLAGFV